MTAEAPATTDILEMARDQVLERGEALREDQLIEILRTGDDRLEELLALAHDVRMRYQGPDIEVEGITKNGLLGGINAVVVGNHLTTLGRDPKEDLSLLEDLQMPIMALNDTL